VWEGAAPLQEESASHVPTTTLMTQIQPKRYEIKNGNIMENPKSRQAHSIKRTMTKKVEKLDGDVLKIPVTMMNE
jgi:hypothetical protein